MFKSWQARRRAERAEWEFRVSADYGRDSEQMRRGISEEFEQAARTLAAEQVAAFESVREGRSLGLIPTNTDAASVWLDFPVWPTWEEVRGDFHGNVILRVGPSNFRIEVQTYDCIRRCWEDVDYAVTEVLDLVRTVVEGRYREECTRFAQQVTIVFEGAGFLGRGVHAKQPARHLTTPNGTTRYAPYRAR